MEERTIVASRGMILLHVAGAVAGLIVSAFMTQLPFEAPGRAGSAPLYGIIGVFAFSGALIASIVRLVRPYRLRLTPSALVVERSFQQARTIAWADVDSFFVTGDSRTPGIGFKYVRASGLTSLAMGSVSGFGRDDVLPVNEFAMTPQALADLLNECRAQGVSAGPPPVEPTPTIVS
ncbi:MAG: hypothetical protein ACHP7N_07205 [Caulobacterales bacterium]